MAVKTDLRHGRRVLVRGTFGHLILERFGDEGRAVDFLILGIRCVIDVGNPAERVDHAKANYPVPEGPIIGGGGDIEAIDRVSFRGECEADTDAMTVVGPVGYRLDYRRDGPHPVRVFDVIADMQRGAGRDCRRGYRHVGDARRVRVRRGEGG